MKLSRVAAAVALMLAAAHAGAQTYPSRPITMIVPFAPGGNTDVLDRVVSDKMSPHLGQQIIVENRPGAGAVIGTNYVAKAKPDGYTVLGYGGAALTPAYVKDLPFDMQRDFAPVGTVYQGSMILLGSASKPAMNNLKDIVAYAKANPGKLTLGAASNLSRAGGMVVLKELGIEAPIILYKASPEVITALARGEIDLAVDSTNPVSRSQIAAGRIRGVLVLGTSKNPVLPEMPTIVDLNLPQLLEGACLGLWVPTGTPQAAINRLNVALNIALQDAEVQFPIKEAGFQPSPGTPEDFKRIMMAQTAFWTDAAKKAGVQPE